MNWSDIKPYVAKAAPLVGSLLGGPAGASVGSLVAATLGVEETPTAVKAALESSPEAAIKIQELEWRHSERLEEIHLESLKMEMDDRQDAREKHAESKMPAVIALLTTFMVLIMGIAFFVTEPPEANEQMVTYFGGQVLTIWAAAMYFWVGTSRTSEDRLRNKKFQIAKQ
ncbi:hypothetical protein [Marisediminitalea sp.]|uniref:hypothetical protein n=1 Tax=Marisediminitalea sp. TaxID=2662268 RepID=UPI00351976AC